MKKKDINHPKLYCDFKTTNKGIELFYYSNKLDHIGNRLIESLIDTQVTSFSIQDLDKLNKAEYNKLLSYILRQERVMQIYLKKDFKNQYQIIKDSSILMYKFKNDFESLVKNES
jgi:hypothetical protein